MASGKNHDRITALSTIPIALATLQNLPMDITLLVVAGNLAGGFLLSPDLDTRSTPYRRWLVLRGIWVPYRKLCGHHRSFWSHGPIVGTIIRVAWLLFPIAVLGLLGFAPALKLLAGVDSIYFLAFLIGLELSALLHLLADWISSTFDVLK